MDEDAPEPDVQQQNEEETVRQRIKNETKKTNNGSSKEKCRTRLDQLATPNKRMILALYQDHAGRFPKDRVEKIKLKLQELYAMTPEETEKYFQEIKQQAQKTELRDRIKRMLRKQYLRQKRKRQEAKAFSFVEQLLQCGMRYSFRTPPPALVSVRLRNLSDIILEQLCDLRNLDHPSRDEPDKCGSFMVSVADWMAIAIEQIYYAVQLKKNLELEAIEAQKKQDDKHKVRGTATAAGTPLPTKTDSEAVEEAAKVPREEDTTISSPLDENYYE